MPIQSSTKDAASALSVTGASANNKVYDAQTSATLSGAVLTGLIPGDAVNVNTGTFNNKTVGTGKAVTALLTIALFASLTSALAVLILWRCFGAAGRWLEDQSCKRATPAQQVQFSALKSIPVNAEEKAVPPCVDVDIDIMVRVFEVFTCSELQDLLRLRSVSAVGNKHDLKKRLATFCLSKESLKLKRL
jgi:hypothetical protein